MTSKMNKLSLIIMIELGKGGNLSERTLFKNHNINNNFVNYRLYHWFDNGCCTRHLIASNRDYDRYFCYYLWHCINRFRLWRKQSICPILRHNVRYTINHSWPYLNCNAKYITNGICYCTWYLDHSIKYQRH